MQTFLQNWGDAALTTLGFFWMALWAFVLGYAVSSMIQVFVTEERMKRTMGEAGPKSVGLATFFGFISSSCSFAALATTKSLFSKKAGLVPSLAFLLASTNLVIELGVMIAIFLTWQFVVGEYVGGVLLILIMWLVVRLTPTDELEEEARQHLDESGEAQDAGDIPDWRKLIKSLDGWSRVGKQYFMEWQMVWKDVLVGFTVAGIIAVFVPVSFFETVFIGTGSESLAWWEVFAQTLIGPAAAFMTFIGSMGNIPLAAILYGSGVSFAGVMAFIFSDLVVFPVIRINAKYYGWKMALYIVGVFLICLSCTSIILHYALDLLGLMPQVDPSAQRKAPGERFGIDYTFFLNIGFVVVTGVLAWLATRGEDESDHDHGGGRSWVDKVLLVASAFAGLWLVGGVIAYFVV